MAQILNCTSVSIKKAAKTLNEMQGLREITMVALFKSELREIFLINAIKATRRQGQQDDSSCPATTI